MFWCEAQELGIGHGVLAQGEGLIDSDLVLALVIISLLAIGLLSWNPSENCPRAGPPSSALSSCFEIVLEDITCLGENSSFWFIDFSWSG